MPLGNRLKEVRIERGLTQAELAGKISKPQSYIASLENRDSKKTDHADKLANALAIHLVWLQTGNEPKYLTPSTKWVEEEILKTVGGNNFNQMTNQNYRNVPLIANVSAGNWDDIFDEHPVGFGDDSILCTTKCSEQTVAFKVNGDSMTAELGDTFPNGTIIYVDPLAVPKGGSYIIARIKDDTQATFKKLIIDGTRQYLKPLNEALPIIQDEFEVLGVVIESKTSYI